ncbi:unnamed protein product [Cochlearia groenlandica]
MEVLKLSKFKLQLQSLIGEVRDLRERERSVTDHNNLLNQKLKQTEEESIRKVQDLEAELDSSRETREALERKVSYLHNDYNLLENKQNELKTTIQNLLQSRESFVNAYQDSFCEMKCSIEARDKKIAILHEKLASHLALFDSIEKEASVINKVVHEVHGLVDSKEDVVSGLKEKIEHVSTYEKVFIEKITTLEEKMEYYEKELQSKENTISELTRVIFALKVFSMFCLLDPPYLQKTLQVKDLVVENLIFEKELLHSEVKSLEIILQRIQESVSLMTDEDRRVFTSILTFEQGANDNERNKNSRHNDKVDKMVEPHCEAPIMHSQENSVKAIPSASTCYQYQNTDCSSIQDDDHQVDLPRCLEHNTNNQGYFDTEDKCKEMMNQPDSECSTNLV